MPRDVETGIRVTGNPLMLSMVVSIFETRVVQVRKMKAGHITAMPATIAELYQVASATMLHIDIVKIIHTFKSRRVRFRVSSRARPAIEWSQELDGTFVAHAVYSGPCV